MLELTKSEEQVLKYIISKPMNSQGKTDLSQSDYASCNNIEPDDFVRCIFILELAGALQDVYFFGSKTAKHNCRVKLTNDGAKYFTVKKHTKRKNFSKSFRDWTTLVIAILAFILSVLNFVQVNFIQKNENNQSKNPSCQNVISESTIDGTANTNVSF